MLRPFRRPAFRLKRALIVAGAVVFLGRVALDGWIFYKNETDNRPTLDPRATCIVKLVRS